MCKKLSHMYNFTSLLQLCYIIVNLISIVNYFPELNMYVFEKQIEKWLPEKRPGEIKIAVNMESESILDLIYFHVICTLYKLYTAQSDPLYDIRITFIPDRVRSYVVYLQTQTNRQRLPGEIKPAPSPQAICLSRDWLI